MRRPTRVLLYCKFRFSPLPLHLITRPNQIDVSKQLVRWIQQEHYGLIDINLFPKPPSSNRDVSPTTDLISLPYGRFPPQYPKKSSEQYAREIMTYLWDNYIL
jgi:histone deacetylase 6